MAKDSDYYKAKRNKQITQLRELLNTMPEHVRDFIYDKELTSQPATLIAYTYDIKTFFQFLKHNNPVFQNIELKDIKLDYLEILNAQDIIEYQHYLEYTAEKNHSKKNVLHQNEKKAISRKFSALRSYFRYHLEHNNISNNPTALVKMPKIKKDKNIVRMNNTEIQDIINAVEYGNEQMSDRQRRAAERFRKRDLSIIVLMLGTGIRVSECVGLDLKDVDLDAKTLTIVRKGGSQDVLYLSDDVLDILRDYIVNSRSHIIPASGHEDALFLSVQKRRLSVDGVENLVKKYSEFVITNKRITPHKLRSTYGTALYRQTGDIRLVADVLGHENVNTTINYYAAIEDEHKKRAANAVNYYDEDDNNTFSEDSFNKNTSASDTLDDNNSSETNASEDITYKTDSYNENSYKTDTFKNNPYKEGI